MHLNISEEAWKRYVEAVGVAVAAAVLEPRVRNWPGVAPKAGIWYSLGLFPDAGIAVLSRSVRMTMTAPAALVVLPQDAAEVRLSLL